MKGGVGKTTLTFNLAACLAEDFDKRVLAIDFDPQFSLTQCMTTKKQYDNYIALVNDGKKAMVSHIFSGVKVYPSMVEGKGYVEEPRKDLSAYTLEYPTLSGHLDLIPSHTALKELLKARNPAIANHLRTFIKNMAKDAYDIIMIDCNPTPTLLHQSAFVACDATLIPVIPDNLSSIGIPLIYSTFAEYETNSGIKPKDLGIVFAKVRQTKLMRETMAGVRDTYSQMGKYVFKNYLRESTTIAESVKKRAPFYKHSPAKKYWGDIKGIADELLARVNGSFSGGV
jgi:chromosome partitioning protein